MPFSKRYKEVFTFVHLTIFTGKTFFVSYICEKYNLYKLCVHINYIYMSASTYIHYVYAYISIGGIYKTHKVNIYKEINTKFTFCLHILLF